MGRHEVENVLVLIWMTVVFIRALWQLYQVFKECRATGCNDDDGDDDPDDGESVPVNDEDSYIKVRAA